MDALTASEQRLITSALLLAAGENLSSMKVNYEALANSAGLKSAASAQVLFCKARRNFLAAIKSKNGGGEATTEDTAHKKVSADKVTKRSPKSPAKGKGAAKASKTAAGDTAVEGTPAVNGDETTTQKKKRAKPGRKAKAEPVESDLAIKAEPEIKPEPEFEQFADGILEGTQYPQTKQSWIQADAVFNEAQAYMSMSEGSSTGSGLSTPLTVSTPPAE